MKVFLSWSGETSKQVAFALDDFLTSVMQAVKPWISATDIEKGAHWGAALTRELDEMGYGVICLTSANLDRPWVNFEAGALAKHFSESRVAPFLFGVEPTDVKGPLAQFQATTREKDDVLLLVRSINARLDDPLQQGRLERYFERDWPEFAARLDEIERASDDKPIERDPDDMIAELLELVREVRRTPPQRQAPVPVPLTKKRMIFGRDTGDDGRPARPVTRRAIASGMTRRTGAEFPPERVLLEEPIREFGEHRVPLLTDDGVEVLLHVLVRPRSGETDD